MHNQYKGKKAGVNSSGRQQNKEVFSGAFSTEGGLEALRRHLLDLDMSNPLLNFSWNDSLTLRITETHPDELYRDLFKHQPLSFQSASEPDGKVRRPFGFRRKSETITLAATRCARTDGGSPIGHPEGQGKGDEKGLPHEPATIEQPSYPADLARLLTRLNEAARTALEKSDSNTLCLVFGFLQWHGQRGRHQFCAPLLQLPVSFKRGELDKGTGFFRFELVHAGNAVYDNWALREKLKADFELELPLFGYTDTPEKYLAKVADFISSQPGWGVQHQLSLALLPLGDMTLYQDLAPKHWLQQEPRQRRSLLSSFFERAPGPAERVNPAASAIGANHSDSEPSPVLEADSSQRQVLKDVLAGENIVVQCPPGTGKVQTIGNTVASALGTGKSVLLVSEKLAALDKVHRKLEGAGLGTFCLPLYGHKANPKTVLEVIARRRKAQFPAGEGLKENHAALLRAQERLQRYTEALEAPVGGKLGLTLHQTIWAAAREQVVLGEKYAGLGSLNIENPADISTEYLGQMLSAAVQLQRHLTAMGRFKPGHPWYGFTAEKLAPGDESAVEDILKRLVAKADEVSATVGAAEAALKLAWPQRGADLLGLAGQVAPDILPLSGTEALELLPGIAQPMAAETVAGLEQEIHELASRERALGKKLRLPNPITHNQVAEAKAMLARLREIGQDHTLVPEIAKHAAALHKLGRGLEEAIKYFSKLAATLGWPDPSSKENLAALCAASRVAEAAPVEFLWLRSTRFFDPAALQAITKANEECTQLLRERQVLQETFIMSALPGQEELAAAVGAFLDAESNGSTAQSASRMAQRTYRAIRRSHGPSEAPQRAVELTRLLEFLEAKERFDSHAEYRRLLGDLFQGLDTDFGKIVPLAQWYQFAWQQLLPFSQSTAGFDAHALLSLPPDRMTWLHSQGAETEAQRRTIEELEAHIRDIFQDGDHPIARMARSERSLDRTSNLLQTAARTMARAWRLFADVLSAPASAQQATQLLEEELALQDTRTALEGHEEARNLLGPRFQGMATDFAPIRKVLAFCRNVAGANLPAGFAERLLQPDAAVLLPALRTMAATIAGKWQETEEAAQELEQYGHIHWGLWYRADAPAKPSQGENGVTIQRVRERAEEALSQLALLWPWTDDVRTALHEMHGLGLGGVAELVFSGALLPEELQSASAYCVYRSVAEMALSSPELSEFVGVDQDQIREDYARLEKQHTHLTRQHCAQLIAAHPIPAGNCNGAERVCTDLALIEQELAKHGHHSSLRDLMLGAGRALQALTPCFIADPITLAQYVAPEGLRFDLVIIDEASAMRPERALGAIARGRQLVVFGDSKQPLPAPPARQSAAAADTSISGPEAASAKPLSLFNLCKMHGYHERKLRWHYRSQHPSLISFSNLHFYDNEIKVAPSPCVCDESSGLRYHYVPGAVYAEHGNLREAIEVADAVIRHFTEHARESLGVVTLTDDQRDLIQEQLALRLKDTPEAAQFIDVWEARSNPFFIKHLADIQGDERDVMLVSLAFGRNRRGVVPQHFGPFMDAEGGRWLNLLATGARKRMAVFSSVYPHEIRDNAAATQGVKVLRKFLEYARDGASDVLLPGGRRPESDFQIAIGDLLRNRGYHVIPYFGVAGYFIDLVVTHPDLEGRLLVGIQSDSPACGPSCDEYEREQLHHHLLQRLEWEGKFYRVWSAAWALDPLQQASHLLEFVESAYESVKRQQGQSLQAADDIQEATPHRGHKQRERAAAASASTAAQHPSGKHRPVVELGDRVTYCFLRAPEEHKALQIGASESFAGPDGPTNAHLALALVGNSAGDEVAVRFGSGTKTIRIIAVDKANPLRKVASVKYRPSGGKRHRYRRLAVAMAIGLVVGLLPSVFAVFYGLNLRQERYHMEHLLRVKSRGFQIPPGANFYGEPRLAAQPLQDAKRPDSADWARIEPSSAGNTRLAPAYRGGDAQPETREGLVPAVATISNRAGLELRQNCAWGNPGADPYRGTVEQALLASGMPQGIAREVATKMAKGVPADRVAITRQGILALRTGKYYGKTMQATTFGRTLCFNTRINFVDGEVQRGDLFLVSASDGNTYPIMVPYVCGNVTRLEEPPPGPPPPTIPEPGTLANVALGLAALAWARRKVRRKT